MQELINTVLSQKIRQEQRYHAAVAKDAEKFFDELSDSLMQFKDQRVLNILVPCSGTFPSHRAFLKKLQDQSSVKKTVNLVLVDLNAQALYLFQKHLFDHSLLSKDMSVKIEIHKNDLKDFLNSSKISFDIVFIEHPVVDISGILFSHLKMMSEGCLEFRQSMAFLPKVLKKDAQIIVACKHTLELTQIKNLLNYSLYEETQTKAIATDFFHKPVNYGCLATNKSLSHPSNTRDASESMYKKSINIKNRDVGYTLTLLLSLAVAISLRNTNNLPRWLSGIMLLVNYYNYDVSNSYVTPLRITLSVMPALVFLCEDVIQEGLSQAYDMVASATL
jgi:hypothetical protein